MRDGDRRWGIGDEDVILAPDVLTAVRAERLDDAVFEPGSGGAATRRFDKLFERRSLGRTGLERPMRAGIESSYSGSVWHGEVTFSGSCFAPCVLLHADHPCRAQRAGENIFVSLGETDMRRSVLSPSAGDGQEQFGLLGDEFRLLLGREHQVSITLLYGGKRGEDAAADAEIDCAEVRTFLGAFEAERDAVEILGVILGYLAAVSANTSARSAKSRSDHNHVNREKVEEYARREWTRTDGG